MAAFDRKLIVGVETEFGLAKADSFEYFSASSLDLPPKEFLSNGMRLYVDGSNNFGDSRDRLEAASAEAPNPLSAVQCLRGAIARTSSYVPDNALLMLNNVDSAGQSWGTHENYLCRSSAFNNMTQLAPHLATRIIFTGAGFVGRHSQAQFSSRIEHILGLVGGGTVAGSSTYRSLLNTRDESHIADSPDLKRLHIIAGESNVLDHANLLKLGTTALVVKLLEDGYLPRVTLSPADSLDFAHKLNDGAACLLATPYIVSRRIKRAIEIQRCYLEACEKRYTDNPPPWLPIVLTLWRDTLEKLETNPYSLVGKVDWITKHWTAAHLKESGYSCRNAFWTSEMLYSNPNSDVHSWLMEEGITKSLVDKFSANKAAYLPPRGTRAWGRGGCIRIIEANTHESEVERADWESLDFVFEGENIRFDFSDPQNPGSENLEKLTKMKRRMKKE